MKSAHQQARIVCVRKVPNARTLRSRVFPLLLLIGCGVITGCNYPDDYVQFRKLPEDRQKAEFKQLPIEKQIDYYLYSMSREPADMRFDEAIASQGRVILPVLLRRLEVEPEYRQTDLLRVIEVMHRKFVPLNEDQEVIDTLGEVVGRMKDPNWQRISEKSLQVIRQKPGTPGARPRTFP